MRQKYIIVIVWLGLLSVCIFQLQGLKLVTDLSLFLPDTNNHQQKYVIDQLRAGLQARQLLIGLRGEDQELLAATSKKLVVRLAKNDNFLNVQNNNKALNELFAYENLIQHLLFRYRYLISDGLFQDSFESENLQKKFNSVISAFASPIAPVYKKILRHDPDLIAENILTNALPNHHINQWNEVWFNANKSIALIMLETKAPGFELEQQASVVDDIYKAFNSIANKQQIELLITGPAVFALQSQAQIKNEVVWFSLLATVSLILFLIFSVRSFRVIILSAIPILTGIITAVTVMNWWHDSVHGITLAFGITLLGVAIDYPMHYLLHKENNNNTMKFVWRTLYISVATTCVGYFVMQLSSFAGLIQLGGFTIVGLVTALLTTRWVLPSFVSDSWHWKIKWQKDFRLATKKLRICILFLTLGSGVYIFVSSHSIWENNLSRLQPLSADQVAVDRLLRQGFNLPDFGHMIQIVGASEQTVLEQAEEIKSWLEYNKNKKLFSNYILVTDLLPSNKTQKYRKNFIPTAELLQSSIQYAQRNLPFKNDFFQPYFQDVINTLSLPLLNKESFNNSELEKFINRLLHFENGIWQLQIPLQNVIESKKLETAIKKLKKESVDYINIKSVSEQMLIDYRDEALRLFAIGLVFIIVMILITYRSFTHLFRVFVPVMSALIITVFILSVFSVKLSLFHLIALLLVMGLGLDYALFLNRRVESNASQQRTMLVLMVCNVSTLLVFGILSFSSVPVLQALGVTVTVGSLLCFLFANMFLRHTKQK